MKDKNIYLKAAKLIHKKIQAFNFVCDILETGLDSIEEKVDFEKLFKPTVEERKEFNILYCSWLANDEMTREQNNSFRITCLLLMHWMYQDSFKK